MRGWEGVKHPAGSSSVFRCDSAGADYPFFAVLIAILYHRALGSFWLYDDTYNLRYMLQYPLWEFFFFPGSGKKSPSAI